MKHPNNEVPGIGDFTLIKAEFAISVKSSVISVKTVLHSTVKIYVIISNVSPQTMGYILDQDTVDTVGYMVDSVDTVDTSHTTVTMAAGFTTTPSTDSTVMAAFTTMTRPSTDQPQSTSRLLPRKFNREIVLSYVIKRKHV